MADRRFSLAFLTPALTVTVMIAVAALLATWSERWLDPQSLAVIFVVPIVVAAVQFGFAASLGAAVLSVAALNFLFVEPRYTFVVARSQDAAALLLLAAIGALASAIGARARAAALTASLREKQAVVLRDLATRLGSATSVDDAARIVVECAERSIGRRAALAAADGKTWGAAFEPAAGDAARWAMSTKQCFRPGADAPVDAAWIFWPVQFSGRCEMALGISPPPPVGSEGEAMLEQIAAHAGLAVARAREAEAAAAARMEAERERLKSELLAGVSHDLRTPLSSIVLTLESLMKFSSEHGGKARDELLGLAQGEARKLAAMVDELLDASRLGRGASPVHLERIGVWDIVSGARAAAAPAEVDRIDIDIAADVSRIVADRELSIRALSNLVANALSHGGGKVKVRGFRRDGSTLLTVSDEGPGLGADPERLFGAFVRGTVSDGRSPGLGLGLSLARRFFEAQGARLTAANASEGGAVFTVEFPSAEGAHGD